MGDQGLRPKFQEALRSIEEHASRRKRGVADVEYLGRDLDFIEKVLGKLRTEVLRDRPGRPGFFEAAGQGLTHIGTYRRDPDAVWSFTGDPTEDDPDSLACSVVMEAETLRRFIAVQQALHDLLNGMRDDRPTRISESRVEAARAAEEQLREVSQHHV